MPLSGQSACKASQKTPAKPDNIYCYAPGLIQKTIYDTCSVERRGDRNMQHGAELPGGRARRLRLKFPTDARSGHAIKRVSTALLRGFSAG